MLGRHEVVLQSVPEVDGHLHLFQAESPAARADQEVLDEAAHSTGGSAEQAVDRGVAGLRILNQLAVLRPGRSAPHHGEQPLGVSARHLDDAVEQARAAARVQRQQSHPMAQVERQPRHLPLRTERRQRRTDGYGTDHVGCLVSTCECIRAAGADSEDRDTVEFEPLRKLAHIGREGDHRTSRVRVAQAEAGPVDTDPAQPLALDRVREIVRQAQRRPDCAVHVEDRKAIGRADRGEAQRSLVSELDTARFENRTGQPLDRDGRE
jgi:hypothetical protein